MAKFIDNVNWYLDEMNIKRNFISLKTGIETSKLSRILSKKQEINIGEMESIANALGQKIEFFLDENCCIQEKEAFSSGEIVFYAGEPKKEQEEFARKLMELVENADEILSMGLKWLQICLPAWFRCLSMDFKEMYRFPFLDIPS